MTPVGRTRRQCPECQVTLTRYEWSRLWWMSSMMSGRLVQPCHECGAQLRLSSMALLSTVSAIGLITTALLYIFYQQNLLLWIALLLLLLLLVSMLATRLEAVPSVKPVTHVAPPSRDEHPR